MRLIWSCTPGPFVKGSFGGYSDRLKGIVTARLLAKRLGREFAIEWIGTTNIAEYFDSKYYAESTFLHGSNGSLSTVDKIESARDVSLMIWDAEGMKDVDNLWMTANQYNRYHWQILNGQRTMESIFADVLDEVFPRLNDRITCEPIFKQLEAAMQGRLILGIAIRIGDQNWDRPGCFKVPADEIIIDAMTRHHDYDAVFIVSDSPSWKKRFGAVCGAETIMLDYQTANPDRSPIDMVRKAFPIYLIEHYMLGRFCSAIITGDGGGGRTATWWGRKPLVELIQ